MLTAKEDRLLGLHCILYSFTNYVTAIPLYTYIVFWRLHTLFLPGQCPSSEFHTQGEIMFIKETCFLRPTCPFTEKRRIKLGSRCSKPIHEMQLWHSILRFYLKLSLPGVSDLSTSLLNFPWGFRSMSRSKTEDWTWSHNADSSPR